MAPPCFGDLGKDAKDILTKNYYFGVFNVKLASSPRNFKLSSNINQNFKAKKIASDFESKLKIPSYGATLIEKWNSDNTISADFIIEEKLLHGLKQTFKYSRSGIDSTSHASIKNCFESDAVNMGVDLFFRSAVPDVAPSLVISHLGYLAGIDLKLDGVNRQVQRANVAIGYKVHDFAFNGLISNWGKCFAASISQRLSDRTEIAGSVSWSREPEQVAWSVGSKYVLDDQCKHFVKTKVDHLSRVSMSLTTFLTKGLQFTLSGVFNGPDMPQLGLAFDLDS